MVFDLYRLDQFSFDEAEPLFPDFMDEAIATFEASEVGEAYFDAYPQGNGDWIGAFLEMAFFFEGLTPAKLTKAKVQAIMEYWLPRKLTLMDPDETDEAIPELVAFWTFLQQTYKLRHAAAIIKYLKSIATQFRDWMFAPSRGGIAKSFITQGMQAGYDMTTEAGLRAFQAEYNQRLETDPANSLLNTLPSNSMSDTSMPTPPADMQQAFELLGIELPKVGESVNPMELMGQFLSAAAQADPDLAANLISIMEMGQESEELVSAPGLKDNWPDIRVQMLQQQERTDVPPIAEADLSVLRSQGITATEPGAILQDFQTFLDFIGTDGIPVSSKLQHLSLKFLGELNEQLSSRIEIDLKRPTQKSYPNIHGLYLLLRATGMTSIKMVGKQVRLVRNPDVYTVWQQLNSTEQYCTLLEAWLIRSHPEMLAEERSGPLSIGDRCLQTWFLTMEQKPIQFANYNEQDRLAYYPGLYNLPLLELFGLVKLTTAKPTQGKGWRVRKVEPLPLGNAVMGLVRNAYLTVNYNWPVNLDPTLPFGDLQPVLQPYFPEWQQNLLIPDLAFRPGRHIFKVSLGKAWRRIAIAGEATLADLSSLVLDSVDFDHDHLDKFTYKTMTGRTVEVYHPYAEELPTTEQIKIGSLPIQAGHSLEYVFDFGDWWEFNILLESVEIAPAITLEGEPQQKKKRGKAKRQQSIGEMIEAHGKAPEQYPEWE